MTRRRLLAIACFTTPLLGVAVACSFPDVSYTEPGVPDGASTDTSSQGDASADAKVVIATDPGDAAPVDLTKCVSCDCDGDGWWRDAGCDAGGLDVDARAGFGDCDDSLKAYHPNQPNNYYQSVPAGATHGFDFDCNGKEEPGIPSPLQCAFGPFGPLSGCGPAGDGFRAVVGCGETGEVVNCSVVTSGLSSNCVAVGKNPQQTSSQLCH